MIVFNLFADGISILINDYQALLVFFVSAWGLGFWVLEKTGHHEMPEDIKLLAALNAGSLFLCALAFMLTMLGHFWPGALQPGSFAVLLLAVALLIRTSRNNTAPRIHNALIGVILLLLLTIRLAFLKQIILPPYSDSPLHYQIIIEMLHPGANADLKLSLVNIFNNYYHFGFHSLAAWLTSLTGLAPEKAISLLGQVFLLLAPASITVMGYILTKNKTGAFFAGLLAAAGWLMPAFAVNWGKFPALGALAVLPAITVFSVSLYPSPWKNKTSSLITLALLAGAMLLHTRIIICIGLALCCYLLARRIQDDKPLPFSKALRLALFYAISLWPLKQLILDFYSAWPVALAWILLLPLAFQFFPRLSLAVFFYTFGIWLVALAPGYFFDKIPALLDRQFVEIMLYIPFALIGGMGFAGLWEMMPQTGIKRRAIAIGLTGCVLSGFLQTDALQPSPCCNYFQVDDQSAFQWIQKQKSEKTLFLIATLEDEGQAFGTDAGVWIYPRLGIPVNKLSFKTRWSDPAQTQAVCNAGAQPVYIYKGGQPNSFSTAELSANQNIQKVFETGQTAIYLVKCDP